MKLVGFTLGVLFSLSVLITVTFMVTTLTGNETRQVIKLNEKIGDGQFADNPKYSAIVRLAEPDGSAFCTAFVIDPNYAVTAAHCLADAYGSMRSKPMTVISENNIKTNIVVKAGGVAPRSDLGLLVGDFKNFRHLDIEAHRIALMDKSDYVACGYEYGDVHLSCTKFIPQTNENFAFRGKGYLVPGLIRWSLH